MSKYSNYKNINKEKNKKGGKQKDSLWMDEENKVIIYSEFKTNLTLDSEKSKKTRKKVS